MLKYKAHHFSHEAHTLGHFEKGRRMF